MTTIKITPTRAEVLRAIADPNIRVFASLNKIPHMAWHTNWKESDVWLETPDGNRRKVTKIAADLEAAGLVERAPTVKAAPDAPRGVPAPGQLSPRHYSLTDAGAAVVADLNNAR